MSSISKSVPIILTVFLVLSIPFYPFEARAEGKKGLEIELYAGTMKTYMGKTIVVDADRTIVTEADDGLVFGLRFGYNFNRFLGAEWNIGASTAKYDVMLFDEGSDVSEEETQPVFFSDLNIVIHLLKGSIIPFVTGGGGVIMTVD